MFKPSLPIKNPKPMLVDEVKGSKLKKSKNTLPEMLNNYDIIRDKVVNDFQPKAVSTVPVKKKLLNF